MSQTLAESDVSKLGSTQGEILNSISRLQDMERTLYTQLEALAPSANTAEFDAIVDEINKLSQTRMTLFRSLSNLYSNAQQSVSVSRNDLVNQIAIAKIIEQQLNDAKGRLNELESVKSNKMRMVEINTYFGKRFQATSVLMKMIIYICIPLLILAVLKKAYILPPSLADFLIGTVLAIGLFMLMRKAWDYYNRNNMNFDEYNWIIESPDELHPTVMEYNRKHLLPIDIGLGKIVSSIGLDCYGPQCCSADMRYDENKRQCVAATGSGSSEVTEEPFLSGMFFAIPAEGQGELPCGGRRRVRAYQPSNSVYYAAASSNVA